MSNGKNGVKTDAAPGALGPYSQAIVAGGMVYCAGQIPLDPATGNIVSGGIAAADRAGTEEPARGAQGGRQRPRPLREDHGLHQEHERFRRHERGLRPRRVFRRDRRPRARPSRWRACRATCWSRSKSWRWPRGASADVDLDRLAGRPRHLLPDGAAGRACAVRAAADRADLADLRACRLLGPAVAVPSPADDRLLHRHGGAGLRRLAEGEGKPPAPQPVRP